MLAQIGLPQTKLSTSMLPLVSLDIIQSRESQNGGTSLSVILPCNHIWIGKAKMSGLRDLPHKSFAQLINSRRLLQVGHAHWSESSSFIKMAFSGHAGS